MEKQILFILFLCVTAWHDWKSKSVPLWIYLVFGILAAVLCGYEAVTGQKSFLWETVGSVSLGFGVTGVSLLCQDSIGIGDGCFFLVSGLYLDFWQNIALLGSGILFCGMFCLVWAVVMIIRYGRIRSCEIPFLPFLVPAGIWMTLLG